MKPKPDLRQHSRKNTQNNNAEANKLVLVMKSCKNTHTQQQI